MDGPTDEGLVFLSSAVAIAILSAGILLVYGLEATASRFRVDDPFVFLTVGVIVAGLVQIDASSRLSRVVQVMDSEFASVFFALLLPPVIFTAGLELNLREFFKNFGPIVVLAFGGTLLNAFCSGLLIWGLCAAVPSVHAFSLVDSLLLGTLLSATDTVAVITVFEHYPVSKRLHALVFGESVLNDAVAIVLFRALSNFQTAAVTGAAVGDAFAAFFTTFLGSLAVGVGVGVGSALLFKHVRMRAGKRGLEVEKAILVLLPFLSYALSEGLEMSGVVSALFCGMAMGKFTVYNVTLRARAFLVHFFRTLSLLFEGLTFVYLGVALPTLSTLAAPTVRGGWVLAVLLVPVLLLGRGVAVSACTWVINRTRSPSERISPNEKTALWFVALRGGVAVALASSSKAILVDAEAATLIPPLTLFIVLASMVGIAGSLGKVLQGLGLVVAPAAGRGPVSPVPTGSTRGAAAVGEAAAANGGGGGPSSSPYRDDDGTTAGGEGGAASPGAAAATGQGGGAPVPFTIAGDDDDDDDAFGGDLSLYRGGGGDAGGGGSGGLGGDDFVPRGLVGSSGLGLPGRGDEEGEHGRRWEEEVDALSEDDGEGGSSARGSSRSARLGRAVRSSLRGAAGVLKRPASAAAGVVQSARTPRSKRVAEDASPLLAPAAAGGGVGEGEGEAVAVELVAVSTAAAGPQLPGQAERDGEGESAADRPTGGSPAPGGGGTGSAWHVSTLQENARRTAARLTQLASDTVSSLLVRRETDEEMAAGSDLAT